MPAARAALVTGLALAAVAIIGVLARSLARSIPRHLRDDASRASRAGLSIDMLFASALLLGAPAVARQVAHAGRADEPLGAPLESVGASLWPSVGLPVGAASVAFALLVLLRPDASERRASVWVCGAAGAGALTVLLSLAGRLVLTDALLIGVAIPTWAWLAETLSGPGGQSHTPAARAPEPRAPAARPGRAVLLASAPIGAILAFLALDPGLGFLTDGITALALLAMLVPVALACAHTDPAPGNVPWSVAPIFLLPTMAPLAAIASAGGARVWVVVDRAGDETARAGGRWLVGAAEALAAWPYLPGLPLVTTPALLGLALPLVHVSLEGVSPGVRRIAGIGILVAGIALVLRGLLGAP